MVNGQVRNRENHRQQRHENRSAHVAMIGALMGITRDNSIPCEDICNFYPLFALN